MAAWCLNKLGILVFMKHEDLAVLSFSAWHLHPQSVPVKDHSEAMLGAFTILLRKVGRCAEGTAETFW